MSNFGKAVVKARVPILIVCLLLLIPSLFGMMQTRINYDMLDYLPSDIETVQGQSVLLDEFGKGAFSLLIVENMQPKDVAALKANIQKIDHVESVIWYDDFADVSVPMQLLPSKYYSVFNNGNATLMAVFFDTSTSADETMEAISQIRAVAGNQCFVSGLSALVTDLKALCEKEEPIYVGIAVGLACAVMMAFMDSWLVPFLFLASIGMAILYNFGTNFFFGDISYITKALCAVLQLAVTMDYSIFLWHSYCEEKGKTADHGEAMARAIMMTVRSVAGSSLTTIAGFIALCFMSYTLGLNLGLVMAKGVLFGVASSVTILPSLILLFDKPLEKTMHRALLPKMDGFAGFVSRHSRIFLIAFILLVVPAYYGYSHAETYYDLGRSLPENIAYAQANRKLQADFNIATTHMALVSSGLSQKDTGAMIERMKSVDGVSQVLGLDSILGADVPESVLPSSAKSLLDSGKYKLILINSEYKVASDAVNAQIDKLDGILKSYDSGAMLIGEAPCTKDMISITSHDFDVVTAISIVAVFVIIALTLKSAGLPVLLVSVIEFAIFINLGIPYYTKLSLPFITPICISTIQLGSTVDYAILMTNRYMLERSFGNDRHRAATVALSASAPSILVSALGFFAATFGVALYSNIDIVSSMCMLMARGAIVSMLSVLFVLPAMLILFDRAVQKTTWLYRNKPSKDISEVQLEATK